MANLDKDFENEADLHDQFEAEQDLAPRTVPAKLMQKVNAASQPVVQSAQENLPGILQSGLDFSKGVASGLTFGGLDEAGGALSALGEAAYNKFNPTNQQLEAQGFTIEKPGLADLYRQNQQAIQQNLQESEKNSPGLYLTGQIAGGVTSAPLLGSALGMGTEAAAGASKAKSLMEIAQNEGKLKALAELGLRGGKAYKTALPGIMAESALSSKEGGLLTPEERSKLGEDVVGGALFGLPTVLGLTAATEVGKPLIQKAGQKLSNVVEESPLLRQMKVAYGYGSEGINPRNPSVQLETEAGLAPGGVPLAQKDNQRTMNLLNEIKQADTDIRQAVGQSLNDATQAGQKVNLSQDVKDSLSQLQTLTNRFPDIATNNKAAEIFAKIGQADGNDITPIEAKDLLDHIDNYIGKLKPAASTDPNIGGILQNLYATRAKFSNTLKNAVPTYGQAAERMQNFRKLVPETILAGNTPADLNTEFMGPFAENQEDLFNNIKKLVQGTTKAGSGTAETRTSFVNAIKGMKDFEAQEAQRLAAGQIQKPAFSRPVSAIEDQIKKYSDDAVARGSMDALQPRAGLNKTMSEAVIGHGAETGRSLALNLANKAGLMTRAASNGKNPVAKLGRAIYNAPDDTVRSLADNLKQQPGLQKYGNALEEALNSTDQKRKNQVLFTIMQNPSARSLVGEGSESEQEGQ